MKLKKVSEVKFLELTLNPIENYLTIARSNIFELKIALKFAGFQALPVHSRLRRRIPDTIFWIFPSKYVWIIEYIFFFQVISFNVFVAFDELVCLWLLSGSESRLLTLPAAFPRHPTKVVYANKQQ